MKKHIYLLSAFFMLSVTLFAQNYRDMGEDSQWISWDSVVLSLTFGAIIAIVGLLFFLMDFSRSFGRGTMYVGAAIGGISLAGYILQIISIIVGTLLYWGFFIGIIVFVIYFLFNLVFGK